MTQPRLPHPPPRRISALMRAIVALIVLVLAVPAAAQPKKPAAKAHPEPASSTAKKLGAFEDWVAATHQENGQTVCYACT